MIGAGLVTSYAMSFNCRQKKAGRLSAQQIFQRTSVNVFQGFDLSHRDVLIDLVNARVRGATFDNLRADLCDEATVRGAAGR